MKRTLLILAMLGTGICLQADSIAPKNFNDWKGYALPEFFKLENGIMTTNFRRHIDVRSTKVMEVVPGKKYRLSGMFRRLPKGKVGHLSFGLLPLNKQGQIISSGSLRPVNGTESALTKDAMKGSRQIFIKDASKWKNTKWTIAAFNAQKNQSDLPNTALSEDILALDKIGNEWRITLQRPLKETYKAGSLVRQHTLDNNYFICVGCQFRKDLPEQWTEISGNVEGFAKVAQAPHHKFWYGTKSVRIHIMADGDIEFKDIVFTEVK